MTADREERPMMPQNSPAPAASVPTLTIHLLIDDWGEGRAVGDFNDVLCVMVKKLSRCQPCRERFAEEWADDWRGVACDCCGCGESGVLLIDHTGGGRISCAKCAGLRVLGIPCAHELRD